MIESKKMRKKRADLTRGGASQRSEREIMSETADSKKKRKTEKELNIGEKVY